MKSVHRIVTIIVFLTITLAGCETAENPAAESGLRPLSLPEVSAVSLDNRPLQVVATTSIIGDVVGKAGGNAIDLTVLMAPGQDPHSYELSSRDLTAAADADVIFVNGWNLEEGLIENLENVAGGHALIPVSAGITPLPFGGHGHEEDEHEGEDDAETADPHVWLDPHNVLQWVENIARVLETLDPANGEIYRQNAAEYRVELEALVKYYDEQLSAVPAEKRVLITNHDSFGYFAAAYDFDVIGTVLPGASTLAEPSANELAALVETMETAGVCTIFAETTANKALAETAAAELSTCDAVNVVPLYSGAIGPPGSEADSYVGMMEANVEAMVSSLVE